MLCRITGFDAVTLQPNSGAQGEYAGLLAIQKPPRQPQTRHHRNVCLILSMSHGTNPASAQMCGMDVVTTRDDNGNVGCRRPARRCGEHSSKLAALMITLSVHARRVSREAIKEICATVHLHGGQVYMDGANLNAQVGVTPGEPAPMSATHEPAQDLLHPARRRWAGRGADRCARASGAVPPGRGKSAPVSAAPFTAAPTVSCRSWVRYIRT